jgi:hypothetical protein
MRTSAAQGAVDISLKILLVLDKKMHSHRQKLRLQQSSRANSNYNTTRTCNMQCSQRFTCRKRTSMGTDKHGYEPDNAQAPGAPEGQSPSGMHPEMEAHKICPSVCNSRDQCGSLRASRIGRHHSQGNLLSYESLIVHDHGPLQIRARGGCWPIPTSSAAVKTISSVTIGTAAVRRGRDDRLEGELRSKKSGGS